MGLEEQFWWGWTASALTAVGTLFLGVVALWGDRLRNWLWPPILRLDLLSPEGEKTEETLTWLENGQEKSRIEDARYYHLRVSNARRPSVATRVQVYLLQVEELAADQQFQVVWNGPVPIGWRHQAVNPIARDIGPPFDCDLCSVVKGKWLRLHPLIVPNNLTVVYRQAVRLRLKFQAQAVEADSDFRLIEVSWDGQWADGDREMTRHLVVKEVAP